MRHLTLWLGLALAALVVAWFVVRTRGDASDAAAMPLASPAPDTRAAAAIEPSAGSAATDAQADPSDPVRAVAAAPAPERVQTPFGALEPVRVRGRLVTPQDTPVRDGLVTGLGGSVVQVAADANGAFEFEVHVVADAAVPQTYVYMATAEACSTKNFNATPRAGEACELGDIVLEPGCSLRAIAVDERGAPLAGASIRLLPGAGEPGVEARYAGPPGGGVKHARTTNAAGVVRLDGLQAGVKRAFLTAPGREWTWSAPLELAPGSTAEAGALVLVPRRAQSRIELRLVDEARRGVAATVNVERSFFETTRLSTDADGRVAIDCKPGESLQLLCVTSSCLRGPLVVEALVADGREHELLVPLNPLVPLAVVDRSGVPIEGCRAYVQCRFAEKLWTFSSYDCEITGPLQAIPVPPEAFDLTIRASGFRAATRSFERGARPERVRIELERDPGIAGIVVAAGRAVEGAHVALHSAADPEHEDGISGFPAFCSAIAGAQADTDVNGRFRIAETEGGRWYALVTARGLAREVVGPLDLDASQGVPELRVELDAGGAIEGFVRGDPSTRAHDVQVLASSGDSVVQSAAVDARGYFRFEGLRAATWQLDCRRRGSSIGQRTVREAQARLRACVVVAGVTARCDLEIAPPALLRGRLRLGGRDVAGLQVGIARPSSWPSRAVQLGAEGTFELADLDAGEYELVVTDATHAFTWSGPLRIEPGENRWEWTPECGSLRTRLPLELGAVVWTLELRPEIGGTLRVALSGDVQGEVWLPWLPAGEYKVGGWLSAELDAKLPTVPNVRVQAGLTAGIAWD